MLRNTDKGSDTTSSDGEWRGDLIISDVEGRVSTTACIGSADSFPPPVDGLWPPPLRHRFKEKDTEGDRHNTIPNVQEVAHPNGQPLVEISDTGYIDFASADNDSRRIINAARRTHAEGYVLAGFVTEDSISDEGFLLPSIDDPSVFPGKISWYHLKNGSGEATMRLMKPPIDSGEGKAPVESLAAFRLTKHTMGDDEIELLKSYGSEDIIEVSALARTGKTKEVFELISRAIDDTDVPIWFFAIVDDTLSALETNLGFLSFQRLGESTQLDDERVNHKRVKLVPATFDSVKFPSNLVASLDYLIALRDNGDDPQGRFERIVNLKNPRLREHRLNAMIRRLESSCLYYTRHMQDDELPIEVVQRRNDIRRSRQDMNKHMVSST